MSISAIQAIGEIGVADSAIYAPLLDQVNSSSYRIQTASVDAINAIVHRDHSRIGQFIVALRDWRQIPIEDRYYSREVIDQLIGSLVATVPELTPGLVECLQTGGLRQRRLAAQGFGSSPAPDDNIINALSASLECPDDQVQSAAMDSLLRLEAKTHRATTALALAAAHSMPEVRGSFARGLARIGPRGIAWTRVLEALAMDPDPAVRREAALALWLVDNQNAPLVQVRIEDLKAPSEFKRLEAVMSLARLGSEAAKAMGPLIEISKTDPSVKVRKEAVRAISRIEQKDGAIPASASAK